MPSLRPRAASGCESRPDRAEKKGCRREDCVYTPLFHCISSSARLRECLGRPGAGPTGVSADPVMPPTATTRPSTNSIYHSSSEGQIAIQFFEFIDSADLHGSRDGGAQYVLGLLKREWRQPRRVRQENPGGADGLPGSRSAWARGLLSGGAGTEKYRSRRMGFSSAGSPASDPRDSRCDDGVADRIVVGGWRLRPTPATRTKPSTFPRAERPPGHF